MACYPVRPTWAVWNRAALTPAFSIGSARKPGIMSPVNRSWHPRYWLTQGKKERARHAGRPDGAMHGAPPVHERTARRALFDMPKARKPRAKRVAP